MAQTKKNELFDLVKAFCLDTETSGEFVATRDEWLAMGVTFHPSQMQIQNGEKKGKIVSYLSMTGNGFNCSIFLNLSQEALSFEGIANLETRANVEALLKKPFVVSIARDTFDHKGKKDLGQLGDNGLSGSFRLSGELPSEVEEDEEEVSAL